MVIICVLAFLFQISMAFSKINVKTASSKSAEKPIIVIDAGHGGEDGGAVNDDGVAEKNINLAISKDTSDIIKLLGFNVVNTRSDDTALTTYGNTIHARKVSDMKNRLNIFNNGKNNVIISIHQNKFPQSVYHGTQIFYSPNTESSKSLAESIKYMVTTLLQNDNKRECKKAGKDIYLLKNCVNPSVIVECGFISNKSECSHLTSDIYQKQMSYSIAMGLLNYYNANY